MPSPKREPFRVSASWIEYAHGPGAESGYELATALCELPRKNGQVIVPAERRDLVREIISVAELYTGPDGQPGAQRVINRARAYLRGDL